MTKTWYIINIDTIDENNNLTVIEGKLVVYEGSLMIEDKNADIIASFPQNGHIALDEETYNKIYDVDEG